MSDVDFRCTPVNVLLEAGMPAIEPSEVWCVDYLQRHGVLPEPGSFGECEAVKNGVRCGASLRQYTKREKGSLSRPVARTTVFMRCTRKHCQTYRSLRHSSRFLTSRDSNEKCRNGLSLSKTLTVVWCWVCDVSGRAASAFTSRSHRTVLHWYRRCRSVAAHHYDCRRGKLGGGGRPYDYVKVDITPFDVDGDTERGPWIFGLCGANETDDETEWRYFFVRARDERVLRAIVSDEVAPGTVVYSDGALDLGDLLDTGYYHATRDQVDQEAGDFTALESLWRKHKDRYGIRYNGERQSVRDKLKTVWWRAEFADKGKPELFDIFWDHVNSKERCGSVAQQQRRRLRRQSVRKARDAPRSSA